MNARTVGLALASAGLCLVSASGCKQYTSKSASLSENGAGLATSTDLEIDGVNPATIESVDRLEKWSAATKGLSFADGRLSVRAGFELPMDAARSRAQEVLGREAIDENRRDAAIIHMGNAFRLDPASAEAAYGLGRAVTLRGKTDEAIACFETALGLRPEWIDARFELGMSLWRAGRLDEARDQFAANLELDPGHGPSLERLAVHAYYAGDRASAGDYARRAQAAGQPVPAALWELTK